MHNGNHNNNNNWQNNDDGGPAPSAGRPAASYGLRRAVSSGSGGSVRLVGGQGNAAGILETHGNAAPGPINNHGLNKIIQTPAVCVERARRLGMRDPRVRTCIQNEVDRIMAGKPGNPCTSQTYQLNKDQVLVYETAKTIAAAAFDGGKDRGQIVYANTGSGKTIMSLCILLAYWNTPRNLFVVTTLSNTKTNSPLKYIQNLRRYFPQIYNGFLNHADGLAHLEKKFQQSTGSRAGIKGTKVTFITVEQAINIILGVKKYASGEHILWGDDSGSVLVIDEAHRLFDLPHLPPQPASNAPREIKNQYERALKQHNELKKMGNLLLGVDPGGINDERKMKLVHIYALSATPASNVKQWGQMVSLVRPVGPPSHERNRHVGIHRRPDPNESAADMTDYIKQYVTGSVIVVDSRYDLATHACTTETTKMTPMDRWYYMAYMNSIRAIDGKPTTAITTEEKKMDAKLALGMYLTKAQFNVVPLQVKSIFQERGRLFENQWVSNKFVDVAKYLMTEHGKQFVYVRSPKTAKLLGNALTAWYGAEDVTAKTLTSGPGWERAENFKSQTTKRNFVIWGDSRGAQSTGGRINKEMITAAFNTRHNLFGRHIKIFIAYGGEYEGTDLNALQHLHIVEPLLNPLKERQAIGRGVRFCAHEGLPPAQRRVHIVRWYLEPPPVASRNDLKSYLPKHTKGSNILSAIKFVENKYGKHHPITKNLVPNQKGYEYMEWDRSMKSPEALHLYNFEKIMLRSSHGLSTPTLAMRFKAISGRPCAP